MANSVIPDATEDKSPLKKGSYRRNVYGTEGDGRLPSDFQDQFAGNVPFLHTAHGV